MTGRVLVVDDDPGLRKVLSALLHQGGYDPLAVADGAAALAALEAGPFELVITDQRMPGMDGLTLLAHISQRWPAMPVIVLTAHASVSIAVDAMKAGAHDFIEKPIDRPDLLLTVERATKTARHRPESPSAGLAYNLETEGMAEVRHRIARAAAGRATVLIRGESGTGKSLTARAIHEQSPRRAGPFVTVHCGALPDGLLQSELFGYARGAFTGAGANKLGRVAVAEGGTLFLDEIGDVSAALQLQLLHLLQSREYSPLGSTDVVQADVRIVAATHRDLEALVRQGSFREDLYYRLNVLPIVIPPLRDRRGEIPDLARKFCATHAASNGRLGVVLSDGAIVQLALERWPGNVRHLENFVERLVVLAEGGEITAIDVRREILRSGEIAPAEAGTSLDDRRKQVEREAVIEALERTNNNRSAAARVLGISRRTLYYKLEEYDLV